MEEGIGGIHRPASIGWVTLDPALVGSVAPDAAQRCELALEQLGYDEAREADRHERGVDRQVDTDAIIGSQPRPSRLPREHPEARMPGIASAIAVNSGK